MRTKFVMESTNLVVNDTTISNIPETGILWDTTIFEIVETDSKNLKETICSIDPEIIEQTEKFSKMQESSKITYSMSKLSAPNYIRNKHPEKNVIGEINAPIVTRSKVKKHTVQFSCDVFLCEPKNIYEAL